MRISSNNIGSRQSASISSLLGEGRRAAGYSVEQLAITCGLTVAEIEAIELGADSNPARLRRVAAALQLPSSVL